MDVRMMDFAKEIIHKEERVVEKNMFVKEHRYE